MSASFILEYSGAPVRFVEDTHIELVEESQADQFIAEADAWYAACKAGLHPMRCRVVNLYARNQQT